MRKASKTKAQSITKSDLDQVKASFDEWRQTRLKRGRVPEHLWQMALELSPHYPISRICRVLGLDYNRFKSCVSQLDASSLPTGSCQPSPPPASPFIEVSLSSPLSSELSINISCSKPEGRCLELSLNGSVSIDDIGKLCKTLLEA